MDKYREAYKSYLRMIELDVEEGKDQEEAQRHWWLMLEGIISVAQTDMELTRDEWNEILSWR